MSVTYLFVCVRAHASTGEGMRVRASVRVGVGAQARTFACARLALLIQYATNRHIVICSLSGCTIFFDIS